MMAVHDNCITCRDFCLALLTGVLCRATLEADTSGGGVQGALAHPVTRLAAVETYLYVQVHSPLQLSSAAYNSCKCV